MNLKEMKSICKEILSEIKNQYKVEKTEDVYAKGIERELRNDELERQRKLIVTNIFNAQTSNTKRFKCIKFMSLELIDSLENEDLICLFNHYFPEASSIKITLL